MTATDSPESALSVRNLNPKVVEAQYAVRGEIVIRAGQIEKELKQGKQFPFDKVVYCNIGNPQSLGQQPISFFRQVLALCDYPELIKPAKANKLFPADVIRRAEEYLAEIPGGTGAYSDSRGADICRQHVALGIERRDGYPAEKDQIFLTDGASQGVHSVMRMLLRDESDAILTPIPQYPLYSATITLYGGTLLPYYLNEDQGWGLDVKHLDAQTQKARSEGKTVRALVVINPGNPTGAILTKQNLEEVVRFCKAQKIVLLADEVYQDNIYAEGKEFHSFKKVVREMGGEAEGVQLFSMHSISKGYYGECGRRGGYLEIINVADDVVGQLYKLASINLCSNVNGQICTALMMNPPQEGDESYPEYAKERQALLDSLKRRAKMLTDSLNQLEGVKCQESEGALYAMPRITLPAGAVEAAKEKGKAPDFLYCMELLEATGIATVPGSGFKQVEGTYHFRTTCLPPESDLQKVVQRLTAFHKDFINKYGGL
ncbi:hypothetical protein WJX72_003409 [[Myrmecia] bisecta]|uniref:Aminotransferase class I/classII large domain-containing protein n=1 Tax=[Myrmecia] bisecta TaxID=41462 RepID=A0AAW1Q726_9CHLO